MNIKSILLLSVIAPIAACGGSDNGSSGASFNDLATRADALVARAETLEATPLESMPTTGTATYDGVAAFSRSELMETTDMLSAATVNANFGDSTISGQLSNFRVYDGTAIDGTVAIQNGAISGTDFIADLSGQLSDDGEAILVDGAMIGGFGGPNAEMLAAIAAGETYTDAEGYLPIYGALIAEAQ